MTPQAKRARHKAVITALRQQLQCITPSAEAWDVIEAKLDRGPMALLASCDMHDVLALFIVSVTRSAG